MRDELGRYTKGHSQSNTGRTHWEKGRIPWNQYLEGKEYLCHFKTGSIWNKEIKGEEFLKHFKDGKTWNDGLTKETNESVMSISKKLLGRFINPSTGFKEGHEVPYEWRLKWSEKTKGQHRSPENEWKKGHKPWNMGLTKDMDSRIKAPPKAFKKGENSGERNPSWKGGISFEPYGKEFNKELKEHIKKRDNFTCQECGFLQEQLEHKLVIHHIDFNKKNNNPNNLISLCRSCHAQTQWNRKDWTNYFQKHIMRGIMR